MTVDLHVREAGSGHPVVLLHAFPLSLGDVARAAQRASASGAASSRRTSAGFGGSPLGDDEPSLDHVADDVAGLLDRRGLDQVVLGGLSMGGYVAMAFLRRHPGRVRALVLADTKASADAGRRRRTASGSPPGSRPTAPRRPCSSRTCCPALTRADDGAGPTRGARPGQRAGRGRATGGRGVGAARDGRPAGLARHAARGPTCPPWSSGATRTRCQSRTTSTAMVEALPAGPARRRCAAPAT